MHTLILKLGATGDVVRTTPLLKHLAGEVSWVTAAKNVPLLTGLTPTLRCVAWEERTRFCDRDYDLVINLEDSLDVAQFLSALKFKQLFGAYAVKGGLSYTEDARGWFDLSLISRFGKAKADQLKLANRRTYQDLIFSGLGLPFTATRYHSLVVSDEGLPPELEVSATATERDGTRTIMGLRHRKHPVEGVQFHPESVLTSEGKKLIRNFLEM